MASAAYYCITQRKDVSFELNVLILIQLKTKHLLQLLIIRISVIPNIRLDLINHTIYFNHFIKHLHICRIKCQLGQLSFRSPFMQKPVRILIVLTCLQRCVSLAILKELDYNAISTLSEWLALSQMPPVNKIYFCMLYFHILTHFSNFHLFSPISDIHIS